MSASPKQHAIRRSTRLPLEVPILVTSLDPSFEFSEECITTLVNAHGCGLVVQRSFPRDVPVRLEIIRTKRHTTARAADVVPLAPRRWRLTDITSDACYLEAGNPFPVDTPVLLSVRVADFECLLEGIVRASYPESGMGVEFVSDGQEHRARAEELINRLVSHREVPRVFVGRKENSHQAKSKKRATALADP